MMGTGSCPAVGGPGLITARSAVQAVRQLEATRRRIREPGQAVEGYVQQ